MHFRREFPCVSAESRFPIRRVWQVTVMATYYCTR